MFPDIHTNFWNAIIAVPVIMILTQITKSIFRPSKPSVPFIALVFGLGISIFISHRESLLAGIFMGWFYGYAAVGSYASLKTTILAYLKKVRREPDG
ncbi:hypothetical protein KP77_08840 [Jeotgalibacillus alimentarius]|uniref:Holin n=1 Tax=Jeotgalibacillus alimentarius TaxID=135826 RepID=A0A0C2VR20_9BACL|nr:hypothetical protein [Jeotgalibacillus alimentarius]KIL51372.1 hypothetical protein KP77_08840 [Jeotgalibacillus alimentarius]